MLSSSDPPAADSPAAVRCGPPPVRLLLLAGLAVLLAAAVSVSDLPGRILTVPVLLGTLAVLARDVVLRPVLCADATRLEVVVGLRRVSLSWSDVERLRVVRDRRTPLLEVDLGESVLVVGPGRLGVAPEDLLEQLQALRAATPGEQRGDPAL